MHCIATRDRQVALVILLLSGIVLAYIHFEMASAVSSAANSNRRYVLLGFGIFSPLPKRVETWQVVVNWLITTALSSVALISAYKLFSGKTKMRVLAGLAVLLLYGYLVLPMLNVVFE